MTEKQKELLLDLGHDAVEEDFSDSRALDY